MFKKIRAYAWLGLGLLRHILLFPFTKKRGYAAWMADFYKEGLLPVSADMRRNLAQMNRCTGCGRCDYLVPFDKRAPSLVLPAFMRYLKEKPTSDVLALAPYMDQIEAVCPEKIELSSFIQQNK